MCGGVEYVMDNKLIRTYFPNPKATLPVLNKDGSVQLVPWGRRHKQIGKLPIGGWARLDSIEIGVWDKYFPKPVKIKVDGFMEKDQSTGVSEWSSLTQGQFMQGLIAREGDEVRVYVVTINSTEDQIHDRWPRILTNSV